VVVVSAGGAVVVGAAEVLGTAVDVVAAGAVVATLVVVDEPAEPSAEQADTAIADAAATAHATARLLPRAPFIPVPPGILRTFKLSALAHS
jgi:thioesterase domain-containing protein